MGDFNIMRKDKDMGPTDVDELLSRIVYKTPENSRFEEIGRQLARERAAIRRRETFRQRLAQWSIAAAVVMAAVVGTAIRLSETTFTSRMQELSCLLPDGSEVTVMPDSYLSYNTFTWPFRRRTVLNGEALFAVTPGRKFTVRTQAGRVRVLGTRFRVKQHKRTMQVACYEGLVQVKTPVGEELLEAGQQAACDTVAITLSEIPEPMPASVSFEAVRLEEVIREIERIFGVTVSGPERYGNILFTGFIITSNLDETLEAVFRACGIPYIRSGDEILLK